MVSSFLFQVVLAAQGIAVIILDNHDGFISLPASRELRSPSISRRRDTDDTSVPLYDDSQYAYLIQLGIGTPEQLVKVAIDTGSSELWVDPDCNVTSDVSLAQQCVSFGFYNHKDSSTFVYLNYSNTIQYGIGWTGIEYVEDSIALPNSVIDLNNVQFGVAIASSSLNVGILGLSFGGNNSQERNSSAGNLNYNNFVDELYLQGVTQSRAFSIALGSADSPDDGVIIFGGIDTSKFGGSLHTVPILDPQNNENLYRYWVELKSISTTYTNATSDLYGNASLPVVVDSGSTFCAFPDSILEGIMPGLNTEDTTNGVIEVDCSHRDENTTLNLNFGDFTIHIPYSDFIMQVDTDVCFLGATPSIDGISVLGDSFLQSAYVVFDQRNMEISMAHYNNCGQSEQAIPVDGVSGVKGNCQTSYDEGEDGNIGSRLSVDIFVLLAACSSIFVFFDLL